MMELKRFHLLAAFKVGVPTLVGGQLITIHPDRTVTRVCTGCGVSVTGRVRTDGRAEQVKILHRDPCPVFAAMNDMGNDPSTS